MGGFSWCAMSKAEARAIRLEVAAEELLTLILKRRRWSATDRDAIAEWLGRAIAKENKAAGTEQKEVTK